jgi:Periplasmic binding protein
MGKITTVKRLCMLLIWLGMAWCTDILAEGTLASPYTQLLDVGKRIYRDGILANGQPLQGVAVGDITLSGNQAACVLCHRRSGMGASEAGQRALPINGTVLYQPGPPDFWYLHEINQPGVNRFRPAYDDTTLAAAIRSGITPTGRTLQSAMPRFNLADADLKALVAYLKSLSDASPAVDNDTIHWATVVMPDADPAEKKAMLDVIGAFFKERNAETSSYRNNGHIPPNRGFAPLRNWELHVWELQGSPETWTAQLDGYFDNRPVFAVLSGVGSSSWQPIHAFCENREVACLFPNTVLPMPQEDNYATYFSKGLTLEAEALAEFFHKDKAFQHDRVVQVYRDEPQGKVPAAAFRQVLQANGGVELKDRQVITDEKIDSAFWRKLIQTERPDSLVLWLGEHDLANLELSGSLPRTVYLSGHRLKGRMPASPKLPSNKVFLVSPWDTQQSSAERFARMRTWMEDKGLGISDELLQGNVLWLMWLVSDAVEQITNHFSPDYLIERIEEMMGNLSNSSLYPRISLGPGQRFVAKGCYILRTGADGQLKPVGAAIVPP